MPTIDIPDKICPHCGGTKWYEHKGRFWCYESRTTSSRLQYKRRNKELYNEKRRTTDSYKRKLEKEKQKRQEYRKLHPIIKPPPLTTAERSARHHAKRKNDSLYKEKNRIRASSWMLINKEKVMTSDRYAKQRLGEGSTEEQRQKCIIYLKTLRKLKQLENEKR